MDRTTSVGLRVGHRGERPRERLLSRGADHLSAGELLAIYLGSGPRGQDVVSFARMLLRRFGSLDAVLYASTHELLKVKGLGSAKVARLKAVAELAVRQCEEGIQRAPLTSGVDKAAITDVVAVSRYLQRKLGHAQVETFACIYLDTRHRLLAYEAPFVGSVNRAYVFPRTLLRRGLELNAAAVVLGHNHPSGVAEPSHADIALTRDLCELFAKVDIKVLDHIVVAAQQTVSMAQRGLLSAAG